MSRGFKITRQDGLTERDSNLAPWLKQFAGKKALTVVEQTRARDTQSLVSQINSIMGSKARYATVDDAVNDMKERTGLDTYLNQLKASSKDAIKTAQAVELSDLNLDGQIDDFEVYMRETDFDPSHPYFDLGLKEGEEDLANDLVSDVMAAITVNNFKPDLINCMNFGLGYVIGAKLSKEDGNVQLKKVFEEVKKKVNKTASEAYPGEECTGGSCDAGQDNFDKFLAETKFDQDSESFKTGVEVGEYDLEHNQVGDILAATTSLIKKLPINDYMSFGVGYAFGAKMSLNQAKHELKRVFNYTHFKTKTAQQLDIPGAKANKIPESLAKYPNVVDSIVSFIKNNIKNTNALGASVPGIQYDLLALFGQKYGIEAQDIMNEDVARFINNMIVSEMSMLGPEEHNPNLGFGVGKDFDMSDNNDAFKGLMPAK